MRLRTLLSCLAGLTALALPLAAQQQCSTSPDASYTAQILKDTTLKQFDTSLTNHLTVDSCVDPPDKFLGHIVGAPNVLDRIEKIEAYMAHLASQSPRVKVYNIGKSEEGRETQLVVISSASTIANLARWQDITAKLADPRGLSPSAADALIAQGKPIYWALGSIHSTETGSPEMLMELAYRVATDPSPFYQNIRQHEIVLITPATQVDGRDRDVELYMHHKAHPHQAMPGLIWWGHYVSHDDNRDGLTLALRLSQIVMNTFVVWHPTVMHDLHESVPYLYIMSGTGPYNPFLDPIEINDWTSMAYYDLDHLKEQGVIGAWTHGFFDGWAPNYMLDAAWMHNSIGRFYETQSVNGADSGLVKLNPSQTSRIWYRPNPPLPEVYWSARDNINMQESGVLYGMSNVATNHAHFLRDFYLMSLHSVQKATTEGPAAYVLPANDPRLGLQARLLQILQRQKVEVSRATRGFSAEGIIPGSLGKTKKWHFPAGSYVIRMDQPYSREGDALLNQEYYSPASPRNYDDTGWTMGALGDVETVKIDNPSVLQVPMVLVKDKVLAPGGAHGSGSVFAINANSDPNIAIFRYHMASTPMQVTEKSFEAAGRKFNTGTVIIENTSAGALNAAAEAAGVEAVGLASAPHVPMHALLPARIAIVHNWENTTNDGWFRVSFDEMKIPYDYVALNKLKVTPDLRSRYDVIILPPNDRSLASLLNGVSGKHPIPWENTPDMPDLAPPGLDSTPDIRGGLGLSGLQHIANFVQQGGLLIAVGSDMVLATETGLTPQVSTRQPRGLDAPGIVAHAEVSDLGSPIAYGYSPNLDVYYSQGLLLSVGRGGGFGGFGGRGGQPGRASGIGSTTVPDVIQARPSNAVLLKESLGTLTLKQAEKQSPRNRFFGAAPAGPPPRVIVRLAPKAPDVLLSGLLTGAQQIANTPMVVQSQYGQGHIVLFAANPFRRNETGGEFSLVLNAAMNYRSLNAGAKPAKKPAGH
ncbi:MAG: M14 family zinc carboxypeptidase [Terriglobales bacterium]